MKRAIIRSVLCTLLSLSMILSDAGIVFAKSDFVFDASDNVVIEELADEEVLEEELLDVNLSEKEVADKETEDVEADLLSEETSEEETVVEDTVTVSENDIEIPIEESIETTVNEADILMAAGGETHNFTKNNGKLIEGKWVNIEGANKATYTPTTGQTDNDVQLRVRVINKAYAGEIFSNQISAKPDTENKIKGHVELK